MLKYILNSLLAGFLSVTFSVVPFAMAENASPISVIKTRIKETKVETAKSFQELFARMAESTPGVNPVAFSNIAKMFQDEKFPKPKFQDFKYKGKDAIRVINQVGGQQVVIEYLFNGDEILKIDGIVFNKADTDTLDSFNKKILSIPTFAKLYQDFRKKVFKASLTPTYEQWLKLTPSQRADYFLRYREVLEAAYKVYNTPRFKVVSNTKSFDQWVNEMIVGEDSDAGTVPKPGGPAPAGPAAGAQPAAQVSGNAEPSAGAVDTRVRANQGDKALQDAKAKEDASNLAKIIGYNQDAFRGEGEAGGPSCIVAGYAREWKGDTCPWNGGTSKGQADFYEKNPISKECKKDSGGGPFIACNPIIYGFNSEGKPHCIDTSIKTGTTDNFNFATHGNGPCETKSPLKTETDKMAFIKGILERGKFSKEVIGTVKLNAAGELVTTDRKLFDKIMSELKKPLDAYIKSAEKICEVATPKTETTPASFKYKEVNMPPKGGKGPKQDKAYQNQACDALMKRALSVGQLIRPVDAPPVIASACAGWGPEGTFEETGPVGKKICGCKDPKATFDTNKKACLVEKPPAPAPTRLEGISGEAVVDLPVTSVAQTNDCNSMWARFSTSCPFTGGDYMAMFLGLTALNCVWGSTGHKSLFHMCESGTSNLTPPVYVDPVCPKPTGCTDPTPVNPLPVVVPPRTEGATNQNDPSINPKVIPPR